MKIRAIQQSDVRNLENVDVFVSPANSRGWMDGGIDEIYMGMFPGVQELVKGSIRDRSAHRIQGTVPVLPVGSALLVNLKPLGFQQELICAPTMSVPQPIAKRPENVYYAMVAILKVCQRLSPGKIVAIPGLGTGVGRISPKTCATMMFKAYQDVQEGTVTYPDGVSGFKAGEGDYLLNRPFTH